MRNQFVFHLRFWSDFDIYIYIYRYEIEHNLSKNDTVSFLK